MKRILIALAAGAVLAGAVYGAAAGLGGVNSPNLGAEDAIVQSCDSDGITVAPFTNLHLGTNLGIRVDAVNIGGLADACVGKSISVVVLGPTDQLFNFNTGIPNNTPPNLFVAIPDANVQRIGFTGYLPDGLNPHDVEKFQIVIQ